MEKSNNLEGKAQKIIFIGKVYKEELYHFQCGDETCKKYWTVGDAPKDKTNWYCTWCGNENYIDLRKAVKAKF